MVGSACLSGLLLTLPAGAQQRSGATFSCASNNGRRVSCAVDTSRADFRFKRQLSGVRCIEGYTWGREDGGVWADRGCRAEFEMLPQPGRSLDRMTRIEPGVNVSVRTNEAIRSSRANGQIFTGTINEDVLGSNGQLAIPQGSNVELIVRVAQDRDLIIDLESVVVNGRRYAIAASPDRVEAKDGVGANRRTGKYVGGGAALGAIIGAIAGGGKGAAMGAGIGAAGGAVGQIATRGREVRIPAESVVTFRVERPLTMGIADAGRLGRGRHYHDLNARP